MSRSCSYQILKTMDQDASTSKTIYNMTASVSSDIYRLIPEEIGTFIAVYKAGKDQYCTPKYS